MNRGRARRTYETEDIIMTRQPDQIRRWPMCGPPTDVARQHHGWKRETPAAGQRQPEQDVSSGATWPGLAAAVAELTARIDGIRLGPAENHVDPGSVIAALAVIGAAVLRDLLPDSGAGLLTGLGLAAARQTAGIDLGSTAD
jgi:hypothetical protein